jgi:hypothetical protein
MPHLVEDFVREALADVDAEILPPGAGIEALTTGDEADAPPVVIVVSGRTDADQFERDLLRRHPEAVVLRIEDNGRILAARLMEVKRRVRAGNLSSVTVALAIQAAPTWRQRFT